MRQWWCWFVGAAVGELPVSVSHRHCFVMVCNTYLLLSTNNDLHRERSASAFDSKSIFCLSRPEVNSGKSKISIRHCDVCFMNSRVFSVSVLSLSHSAII
jgi:hypothetical protein